ncbi:WD40 repeat-like protein [Glonium stellatum]|uniref:WD40 repeat-like protein n=1 Tax=Glonium stellatum TaxID=574774 RepID=A0A8E2F5C3_9PEZI|nr:WD40 repeat-like protein [Glonium stellatum]
MSKRLKRDICDLHAPGTFAKDVQVDRVDQCLPAELQYVCRFWVQHLQKDEIPVLDNGPTDADQSPSLNTFIRDTKRVVLNNRAMIEEAPPQIYSSMLIFLPEKSIVREQFIKQIPSWIYRLPTVTYNWSLLLHTFNGHSGFSAVVFSPDGKLLASASTDWTVRLWDPATGAELQTLQGHLGAKVQPPSGHLDLFNAVTFSSDSKLLASASENGTVRLWNPATGAELQTLKGYLNWVKGVLWNPATGIALQTVWGHSDCVNSAVFSLDNKLLASASGDKTIRLRGSTIRRDLQMPSSPLNLVVCVKFSPNSEMLASASKYDSTITLWDPATGVELLRPGGHSACIDVVFSPDGKLLASVSTDDSVSLWNLAVGVKMPTSERRIPFIGAIVIFSPDSKLLASALDDKTVRLWDLATGVELQTLKGHSDSLRDVAFSPDGKLLASASNDKTIKLWNLATGVELRTIKSHLGFRCLRDYGPFMLAFLPDGKLLASPFIANNTVTLWDLTTGAALGTVRTDDVTVRNLSFSSDSRYLYKFRTVNC